MSLNEEHYCVCMTPDDLSTEDRQLLGGEKAALLNGAKWPTGSIITVKFLGGDLALQERVKKVALEWTQLANLTLDFRTSGDTNIRIAFEQGNGSWSYLGTMCRRIPQNEPTMNYGWLTPTANEEELRRVVLHEFGHALGLIHEHQNPQGGIKWNKDAVKRDLSNPPNNWDDGTIENNMFKKYTDVTATKVDSKSIMMYPIPKSWTLNGFSAQMNGELSQQDKDLIKQVYPK
jgi:serralysin